MSKKETSGDEQIIDLQELLRHSRQIDENIEAETTEANRRAAMEEFGLVEASASKSTKNSKSEEKLKAENESLKAQIADLQQQNQDLTAAVADRDQQIARLGEQIELQSHDGGPLTPADGQSNIPSAPTPPWAAA